MNRQEKEIDTTELLNLWYEALNEPIGLLLETPDPFELRTDLYKARAEAGDIVLSVLEVRMSPYPEGDLVICHPVRQSDEGILLNDQRRTAEALNVDQTSSTSSIPSDPDTSQIDSEASKPSGPDSEDS